MATVNRATSLRVFVKGCSGSVVAQTPDVEAKNLQDSSGTRPTMYAHLQHNIIYVLVAIPINSRNEVLLIQESRKNCAGTWYLPTTRLEPKERITDFLKKQTFLQTGLNCEILTLVSLESQGGRWHRLTFLVKTAGGKVKMIANEHSQQAQWVPVRAVIEGTSGLSLRSEDAVILVSRAKDVWESLSSQTLFTVMPTDFPHGWLSCRLVLARRKSDATAILVLRSDFKLPLLRYAPKSIGMEVMRDFFEKVFEEPEIKYQFYGVFAVEHQASLEAYRRTDGMCVTLIAKVESSPDYSLDVKKESPYKWLVMIKEDGATDELASILDGKVALPSFKMVPASKQSLSL